MAPTISVAVVDAKTPGNIGTIARSMKNFGVEELLLIDPPEIGPGTEAYGFAGRARDDILANARELTFDELTTEYHTVGFTTLSNPGDPKHIRTPVQTPRELVDRLSGLAANTALVFGRERIGLRNEELAQLDELCTIPANPDYATLNLGQAATVALYELRDLTLSDTHEPVEQHQRADAQEIEALFDHLDDYLDLIDFPAERRPKTDGMLRRVLGRADMTSNEVLTFHGILSRSEWCLTREENDKPDA